MSIRTPLQIIIIGIDGATMDLILPWATDGRLPGFKRLIEQGTSGKLLSTITPVTAPAWTSFMTGKNPGKHNLFDFIEHVNESYEISYANSLSRRSDTIWRILSDSGKKVGVINVPMTFPPEEINGFFISGMDTPDENSDFIYPRKIGKELEELFGKIKLDIRHLGHMNSDRIRDKVIEELEALEEQRKNISLHLLKNYDIDVFMVVFNSTDQVQHHFWHYMDKSHPQYDPKGSKKYGDTIYRIYRKIDKNLLDIMQAVGEDAVYIIMSDHGAGPVGSNQLFLNNYLQQIGVLKYKTGAKEQGKFHSTFWALLKKMESVLKANLSTRQKMALTKLFPRIRNKFESYLSLSMIDWHHTRAYSIEIFTTSANIWINLKGNRPNGIVDEKDYDSLTEFIVKKLYELKDSDGRQVIKKVYRKNEIYNGPFTENAPDLILDWWTGDGFIPKNSISSEGCGVSISTNKGKLRGGIDWSGTHKINGTFLAEGYPFKKGFRSKSARIIDIAPTVLYLSGLPIPDDMDGRVLLECLDEEFVKTHPVACRQDQSSKDYSQKARNYSEEEAEKIKERLKGLGYIS
jgi:predicted AlkP superfamily phosphohydrolase/phosphomutase